MSVISAENLLVENCVFKNTNGTAPSSGIDIEPDVESDKLVNVIINDCISENNAGSGMQIYLRKLTAKSDDVSILFVNCHILRCGKSGIIAGGVSDDGPKGLIEFRNCVAEDLNSPGLYIFDKSPDGADLRFDSCKWANVAKLKTTSYLNNPVNSSPIHFFLRRREVARRFGGVSFVNCYVYDDKDRPFLTATEQGQGVYDIEGDFNIYNPFGAKENLGKKNESIKLQIRNQYQRNK